MAVFQGFQGAVSPEDQGFDSRPTVTDLSHLADGWPAYGSSQSGGNTLTAKDENFAGQGSPSEAAELQANPNVHSFGDIGQTTVYPAEADAADDHFTNRISR